MKLLHIVPACAGLLLLAFATSPSRAADLPLNVFVVSPDDGIQDLIYFAEDRPVFLRLHVRIGKTPFRIAWHDFVIRLHQYLDADGDGVLTLKECQRGTWQQSLFTGQFAGQRPLVNAASATPGSLDADKDGRISVTELGTFLRTSPNLDGFSMQAGPGPDPKAQAIFAHLDLDRDGRLSAEELAAADECFTRLDLDEDELLTVAEMQPYQNPYADRFRPLNLAVTNVSPETTPIMTIGPGSDTLTLIRRLRAKYHRGGQENAFLMSRSELNLESEAFRHADINADGALDGLELEALLLHPPASIEFALVAPAPGKTEYSLEPIPSQCVSSAGSAAVRKGENGGLFLELDDVGIDFTTPSADNSQDPREQYMRAFKIADTDANGYLDKKEMGNRGLFQQGNAIADRDADGKLFEKEWVAFLDLQADAVASRMTLTISDRGRALFEVLDTTRDQRLSLRELRNARARLAKSDRNGDGQLSLAEVPRRFQITLGRGFVPLQRRLIADPYEAPPSTLKSKAPSWFDRMDRNHDGDLSVREFLGTRAVFQRLDADGDGLIDPQEATQAR